MKLEHVNKAQLDELVSLYESMFRIREVETALSRLFADGEVPSGNGKAVATEESEGFIKTVFDDETGELLGAHLIGPQVTELIHGYAIGQKAELTEESFMDVIFPHPTLSEAKGEAVLATYGRALHA